jgi:hypothetical protein
MPYARRTLDESSTLYGGVVKLVRRDLGIAASGIQAFGLPSSVRTVATLRPEAARRSCTPTSTARAGSNSTAIRSSSAQVHSST